MIFDLVWFDFIVSTQSNVRNAERESQIGIDGEEKAEEAEVGRLFFFISLVSMSAFAWGATADNDAAPRSPL